MDKRELENIVREVLSRTMDETRAAGTLFPEQECKETMLHTPDFSQVQASGVSVSNNGRVVQNGEVLSTTHRGTKKAMGTLTNANGGLVQVSMPLALAVKLIEQIEAKAAEWNMRVVTAVSDASGRPVAVHCMDGAYMGSFDVALNKTYTSIAFQMSTAELGKLSQPGMSLYGIQFTNEGRIVIFGGGEVLTQNGVIIGALGVSGGSAQQDTELAAYGKKMFESELEQEVIKCL